MLPSFAQAFANDTMSTTLPPIRKRPGILTDGDDFPGNKKRRLTHSPHPLRTDLDNASSQQSISTPISPIGFTVQRDLIDHVRSANQIRKKQEALIEQRRESIGALPTDDPPAKTPSQSAPQQSQQSQPSRQDLQQQQPAPLAIPTTPSTASPRPQSSSGPSSSRLPPPPISFANRAVNAGKKKPADLLLVNHRDPPNHYLHPNSTRLLQGFHGPSIQSAPPSQNAFSIPMALPRLPSNLVSGPPPAIAGSRRVPPTPTRLSMLPSSATSAPSLPNGKSPPASIPIATTLLPNTPTSLTINRAVHLGNALLHPPSIVLSSPSTSSGPGPSASAPPASSAQAQAAAKQAFLAPFELFYDALQDARQLKAWLNDQLTKTASLTKRWEDELTRLEREREANRPRGGDSISNGVTRVKIEEGEGEGAQSSLGGDLREELEWLRRRVDELEGRVGSAVLGTTATATASSSSSTSSISSSHEGYIFPQQPQQQQQYEMMQQQKEYLRQREREHPSQVQKPPQNPQAASTSLGPHPLPAISRRLSLSGRPESARRPLSPGWHSSPSIGTVRGGPGTGSHRGRGKGEGSLNGVERGRTAGMLSKSLSGPGTCGSGGVFSSGQSPRSSSSFRKKGRRVSISGGVVPGAQDRDGESLGEGTERLGESERERPKREMENKSRVQEEEEMNVDSVGGVEVDVETRAASGGADKEQDKEQDKGEEGDRGKEESRQ